MHAGMSQEAAVLQQPQLQQHQAAAGQYVGAGLHAPTAPSGVRWPSNLRPAFRSSPRNAQRRQPSDKRARILFLDEGNMCRCGPAGANGSWHTLLSTQTGQCRIHPHSHIRDGSASEHSHWRLSQVCAGREHLQVDAGGV